MVETKGNTMVSEGQHTEHGVAENDHDRSSRRPVRPITGKALRTGRPRRRRVGEQVLHLELWGTANG